MKANPHRAGTQRRPLPAPRATPHRIRFLTAAGLFALASACAGPRVIPPAPEPAPAPTSAPAPAPQNWIDAPVTPGDWNWSASSGASTASFARGLFVMRCDTASRTVTLTRALDATSATPPSLTIITQTATRQLPVTPQTGAITASVPARDPLLDAMAFSKGRFAVTASGLPMLSIPSWAEVGKVIEDCR